MKSLTVTALKFLLAMTLLTGIVYPFMMTGFAQLCFPFKANGSIIKKDGQIRGSVLIGQKFDSSIYFWSRPSATAYNPIPSGASNYGPTSDTLKKLADSRRLSFGRMNSVTDLSTIPKEMLFASGSGLDPQISPEAALMQTDRIVKARHFDGAMKEKLIKTINDLTEKPQYSFLGEKRINVLLLNLELDEMDGKMNNNK